MQGVFNRPEWHATIARALTATTADSLAQALTDAVGHAVTHEGTCVMAFHKDARPEVLHHTLEPAGAKHYLDRYLAGPYLLDPLYALSTRDRKASLCRFRDELPDRFRSSEYYRQYCERTHLLDEMDFLADVTAATTVVLVVGRRHRRFTRAELQRLELIEPTVQAALRRIWALQPSRSARTSDRVDRSLKRCFEHFGEAVLTERERQVSQLLLRGHSSKSIARELDIAPGTVMVHKRNLFAKLNIRSQYELFSLLIDELGRAPPARVQPAARVTTARLVWCPGPYPPRLSVAHPWGTAMFDFDFALGEDVDLLRETVRGFAQDAIAPRAAEIDRSNRFPRDLWPKLGELGLLGITVEAEHGGAGLGYLAHVVAMEELSRASASVGLSYGAHSNLCVNQIRRWGTEEQKRKYLPKLISGEHVGALAMSETGAGSDVMSMRTRAVRQGDDWVLTGSKMWITNAPEADVVVLYANTAGEGDEARLSAFIVEPRMPGYSRAQKLDKLGMRGSDTGEIVLDNCLVPGANLLGHEGQGAAILMSGLDYERLVLAGGPLGIMRACFDVAMPYVHDRKQFGRPIGSFQLMQGKIADMYTAMNSARAYVYTVARACDAGHTTRFDAAACILFAAEKATWMAGETVQALGGNGYINEYPAGRLWRDAKLYEIGAGTSEIRRMLIGRELFTATGP